MMLEKSWWPGYPMLRLLIPLIGGILLYGHISVSGLGVFFLAVLTLWATTKQFIIPSRHYRIGLAALPISALMLLLGFFLMYTRDLRLEPVWFAKHTNEQDFQLLTLKETFSSQKNRSSGIGEYIAIQQNGNWKRVSGRLNITVNGKRLNKGDIILFQKKPVKRNLESKESPSFSAYLQRKQVFHQVWLDSNQLTSLSLPSGFSLVQYGKSYMTGVLDSLFRNKEVRSMSGALLLGERAELSKDMKNAYIQTGVIHVIAISGMHLAIIYFLITMLLRPLQSKKLSWVYLLLSIALIWLYAWICGGSPSVIRSAWMFSFMLSGQLIRRDHNAGNSLAASAMVMLCADPALLWDIGFQLSHAAVASLLIYQRSVSNLLRPVNLLLFHAWNTISTSVAAQILTTPLVIYHFSRFPVIFLLGNLVAVPVSGIILVLLCACCLLFPLGVGKPLAYLTEQLILLMNTSIFGLGKLNFATINELKLSIPDTVNIYILILAMTLWIRSKKGSFAIRK